MPGRMGAGFGQTLFVFILALSCCWRGGLAARSLELEPEAPLPKGTGLGETAAASASAGDDDRGALAGEALGIQIADGVVGEAAATSGSAHAARERVAGGLAPPPPGRTAPGSTLQAGATGGAAALAGGHVEAPSTVRKTSGDRGEKLSVRALGPSALLEDMARYQASGPAALAIGFAVLVVGVILGVYAYSQRQAEQPQRLPELAQPDAGAGGKKAHQRLSQPSQDALTQLGLTGKQLAAIEASVDEIASTVRKKGSSLPHQEVLKLWNEMAHQESLAQQLEGKGVDNIYTGNLETGQTSVKAEKKEMLKRLEDLFGKIKATFAELKKIEHAH